MKPVATPQERHAIIVEALEHVRSGKTFAEISEITGIHQRTLNAWLLAEIPEQYKQAQRSGVVSKMIDLAETLETAGSHLLVSRTRETLKFWQWVAERRLREFAPKQEISGPDGGPIQVMDNLERARRLAYIQSMLHPPPIDVTPTIVNSSS